MNRAPRRYLEPGPIVLVSSARRGHIALHGRWDLLGGREGDRQTLVLQAGDAVIPWMNGAVNGCHTAPVKEHAALLKG